MSLNVDIKGVQELLNKMATLQKFQPLNKLLTDAALIAQREARSATPQDTRTLARSIALDVQPFSARVFTPLAYAPVMEYGRRPGGPMPPPDALGGWLRRHGIPLSAAFVVARAIARRGIKGRFFMQKGKDAVQSALPRLISDMEARLKAGWG